MSRSGCPDHVVISALLVGALDDGDIEAAIEHIAGCSICQSTVHSGDGSADALISRLQIAFGLCADGVPQYDEALDRLLAKAAVMFDSLQDLPTV
jgi:hypothetical protein